MLRALIITAYDGDAVIVDMCHFVELLFDLGVLSLRPEKH